MKGCRRPDGTGAHELEPGDYAFRPDLDPPHWYACAPNGLVANLANHSVLVNADGSLTVAPSILVSNSQESWHGYLEHGVWREC